MKMGRNDNINRGAKALSRDQILTVGDFLDFKEELLTEIAKLIQVPTPEQPKEWLRSKEVCKLLKISPATLFHLREENILPCTKISGVFFYERQHIDQMLASRRYKPEDPA